MAARTALVVVDVQRGFDDDSYWGHRNNPDCERNVADLIESWRGSNQLDLDDHEGGTIAADELARVTAANLDPEFGRVLTAAEAIAELRE